MGDVDGVRLQMSDVEVRGSSTRQTPLASFGETFKSGLTATANVVGNAAASAGYAIPGAAVVGAAITGVGTVRDTSGGLGTVPAAGGLVPGTGMVTAGYGSSMNNGTAVAMGGNYAGSGMIPAGGIAGTNSALVATAPGAAMAGGVMPGVGVTGGGYMDAMAGRAATGDPGAQLMMATQQMQEMNQVFNLQYLQLQEKMQAENRQFTALSNVMKTKQDTAKNSLSNLK